MQSEVRHPAYSLPDLCFPLFLSLSLEVQEEIVGRLGDTGTTWRTGTTLHINGVLFEREATRGDTVFVALNTHLGLKYDFIKEVRLISYLFESQNPPHWGIGRKITRISARLFHHLRGIIPREIPIILEEEDRDILELQRTKPFYTWYTLYEQKYHLPLTFQPEETSWPIL